jgi:hypothetical protein
MYKCNFKSTYIPQPQEKDIILEKFDYKLRLYTAKDQIQSIRDEFEKLHENKYTHVANMPGNMKEILNIAKQYQIICLDTKLNKRIADHCSKSRIQDIQEEEDESSSSESEELEVDENKEQKQETLV